MASLFKFITNTIEPLATEIDFVKLVQTIQYLNKNTIPHYRAAKNYVVDIQSLANMVLEHKSDLIQELTQMGYTAVEAELDFTKSMDILHQMKEKEKLFEPQFSIPQRFLAVYGSWSSPLYRFFKSVVPALTQENSVLLFCEPEASKIYCLLAQWISSSPLGLNRIAVLPLAHNEELVTTLLEHPSIQGIEAQTHLYHSELFRKYSTSPEKTYNLHFGAHNPVIILNDAPVDDALLLLESHLKFHRRSEIRFNRWFVQEKIYPELIKTIEILFQKLSQEDAGASKNFSYLKHMESQSKELKSVKHWLAPFDNSFYNVCTDFSNCSPLHQTELLGPRLTITRVKNINEATKFANTTFHSNATCIVTQSEEKFLEAASQQRTPFVFKNTLPDIFDPCFDSGDRFCSLKTVNSIALNHRTIIY